MTRYYSPAVSPPVNVTDWWDSALGPWLTACLAPTTAHYIAVGRCVPASQSLSEPATADLAFGCQGPRLHSYCWCMSVSHSQEDGSPSDNLYPPRPQSLAGGRDPTIDECTFFVLLATYSALSRTRKTRIIAHYITLEDRSSSEGGAHPRTRLADTSG